MAYTEDFKSRIVALFNAGASAASLSREFGPSATSIRAWFDQARPTLAQRVRRFVDNTRSKLMFALEKFPPPPLSRLPRQQTFPVTFESDPHVMQRQTQLEQRLVSDKLNYAHWWVAWELVRRSPRHFDLLVGRLESQGVSPPNERDRFSGRSGRGTSGPKRRDAQAATGSRQLRRPLHRGDVYPAPSPDGSAPPESGRAYENLRSTLGPVLLPPVIIGAAARHWLSRVPAEDYDHIDIHVHRSAAPSEIVEIVESLRHVSGSVASTWVVRPFDAWGSSITAAEAVRVLDRVSLGEGFDHVVRDVMKQRTVDVPGRPAFREKDFPASRTAARRFCERSLAALHENPLLTLIGRAEPEQAFTVVECRSFLTGLPHPVFRASEA